MERSQQVRENVSGIGAPRGGAANPGLGLCGWNTYPRRWDDVLAQNFVKVEERDAFRVEFRIDVPQAAEQRSTFLLPGKERAAVVVYSAPTDRFATARLAFETLIQATRGLDEPEPDRTGQRWRMTCTAKGVRIGLASPTLLPRVLLDDEMVVQWSWRYGVQFSLASLAELPNASIEMLLDESGVRALWRKPERHEESEQQETEQRGGDTHRCVLVVDEPEADGTDLRNDDEAVEQELDATTEPSEGRREQQEGVVEACQSR
jgi:hypothetical protein